MGKGVANQKERRISGPRGMGYGEQERAGGPREQGKYYEVKGNKGEGKEGKNH